MNVVKDGNDYEPQSISRYRLRELLDAERTLLSLVAMLGWGNLPPRETLERQISELKRRATEQEPTKP